MPTIKQELTNGVFWIAVGKYSGLAISLIVTAILARNVSPAAFGTMAVATVIMAFLDIFTDMGLGPAVIQYKDLEKTQIFSLFSVSIIIALILTLSLFGASEPLARFYSDPVIAIVARWLCICLLFNALNIIPNALMLKAKRFKAIAIRTLFFQIISGTVACVGALHGWGIYALLISPIITSIGVFCFNFYNYPQKPVRHIDWEVMRRIWKYSSFQFLFTFINYFSRNSDKLIIGKFMTMSQLGYYEKSYRLMLLPLQNITSVVTPVLHPILSTLQNNKAELGDKNRKLLSILANVSFPVGILLFFCAPEIILIIFGDNWAPSIPVFRILAISVPLQVLLSTSGSMFQAAGRTDHLFYTGFLNACITISGFIFAAIRFHSIEAMAWAWVITLIINFVSNYTVMYRFTFSQSALPFFKMLTQSVVNSVVTIIVTLLMLEVIKFQSIYVEAFYKMLIIGITTLICGSLLRQYSLKHLLRISLGKIIPKK